MGNKCTCFGNLQDQQTCDLSNNNNNINNTNPNNNLEKSDISHSFIHMNVNSGTNMYSNDCQQFQGFQKTKPNSVISYTKKNYTESDINKISKNVKGFLFRLKFNKQLKTSLTNFANDLFNAFCKTNHVSIRPFITTPPIDEYIKKTWDEFNEDDVMPELPKINSKHIYHKGFVIKYSDKNFQSNDALEIIDAAESIYKGDIDIFTREKNGKGELVIAEGSIYKNGTFINDEFNGWNYLIDFKDNVLYLGFFTNGSLNGKGLRYSRDRKFLYKGEFKDGMKDGTGDESGGGLHYIGEYHLDKKQGKGSLTFESGDTYEGEFANNVFNGQGHYKWKKNGHEYIGGYLNGKFDGNGMYKWGENEYYKGEYKNGIKEGMGELKYPDGKKFTCPFVNGKPHGIGMMDDGKGNKREVEFIDGKINKKYKPKKGKRM